MYSASFQTRGDLEQRVRAAFHQLNRRYLETARIREEFCSICNKMEVTLNMCGLIYFTFLIPLIKMTAVINLKFHGAKPETVSINRDSGQKYLL